MRATTHTHSHNQNHRTQDRGPAASRAARDAPIHVGIVRRDRVAQQHRHRHRPDAAWNRGDPARALLRRLEVHVANELAALQSVDAHVDDDGARPYPLALHQAGLAAGDDEALGVTNHGLKVLRKPVHDLHRGAVQQELEHHGAPHMVARAYDDAAQTVRVHARAPQQVHHAEGRARPQLGLACDKAAEVERVETVHVLVRSDRLEYGRLLLLQLRRGQRQLHQDAVAGLVLVQAPDRRQQLRGRGLLGQLQQGALDAHLLAGLLLLLDVHFAGRIGAHEHHHQPRRPPAAALAGAPLLELRFDDGTHLRRYGFAIDQAAADTVIGKTPRPVVVGAVVALDVLVIQLDNAIAGRGNFDRSSRHDHGSRPRGWRGRREAVWCP
mmetsp:Transcript_61012/g.170262  ORF Transcript_61012/g.170262 Transcript_61012/m.170262 type:complete len:382 (+) Transcript_61012:196-1341(+)